MNFIDSALSFDIYAGEPGRDGVQGVTYLPDGKVKIRLIAPNAKEVVIDQFGRVSPLAKAEDGAWEAVLDLGRGFQYLFVKVDGCEMLSPYLPIGFGACRPMNYVDVPYESNVPDEITDVPHGAVERRWYYSSVTEKYESCLVYLPAGFDTAKKYPVLYLQHGYGENETGWVYQGHVARIADNLIHAGKAEPMLIVMGNGMTRCEHRRDFRVFPDVLLNDLIPYIESSFNVYTDSLHRAMAGLSMGSFQTSVVTLTHPDMFSYAGVFSGFVSSPRAGEGNEHLALLKDSETFNKSFRVFYRAMGKADTYFNRFVDDDPMFTGLNAQRAEFEGGHEWNVWRQCIADFLPKLFK